MIPVEINKLVEVTFADGSTRHLRYTLGARKRITEKFGTEPMDILKQPPEQLLPFVLMEGVVERDGISEEAILENLVTAPMTDYITLQFIESFFAPRVAQNLKRVIEALQKKGDDALAIIEKKTEAPPLTETASLQ